jgi:anti-anti-sigma factor
MCPGASSGKSGTLAMNSQQLHLHDSTLGVVAELRPPALCVSLRGELDFGCCDLLEALTGTDGAGIAEVVVDLSGLTFCDVAGFRALVAFRDRQATLGRAVRFVRPQRCVLRLAALMGRGDFVTAS